MWAGCFIASVGLLVLALMFYVAVRRSSMENKWAFNLINTMFVGISAAVVVMFFPIHSVGHDFWRTLCLSVLSTMQVFTTGCDFNAVADTMVHCPDWLDSVYLAWAAMLFVLASRHSR